MYLSAKKEKDHPPDSIAFFLTLKSKCQVFVGVCFGLLLGFFCCGKQKWS